MELDDNERRVYTAALMGHVRRGWRMSARPPPSGLGWFLIGDVDVSKEVTNLRVRGWLSLKGVELDSRCVFETTPRDKVLRF